MLQKIASETGGTYQKSVDEKTLDQIYKNMARTSNANGRTPA